MTGNGKPYILEKALGQITELLCFNWLDQPPVWLLGGSCGLMLHGVKLNSVPRDIDLYGDLEDAQILHDALKDYAVDKGPEEDYSGGCFSLRSRYLIGKTQVELVCGFEIGCGSQRYRVDVHKLQQYAPLNDHTGVGLLRLMPLAHELIFNLLRGRTDRSSMIAACMKAELPVHLQLLQRLCEDNRLDNNLYGQLNRLLDVSSANREQEGSCT
ncbi:hypothetical protein C2I18_01935 [Paenibacillus sp. PK3_47]|uniref:hypothetical protein n=1 Tax=Paenibacillus sp. PK3_47 TaxID=2072642 RepID=UPI00201D6458|nr:hypothetical protein [Paenibacillus sp. PK3_47]UQZ32421.1 hypothetical protein C2I18_01935 [Paenibacillus sp. PK3_47]